MRASLVAVLFSVCLVPTAAAAAPAEIAGTTVVTGTGPASTLVRVPADAEVARAGLDIEGTGAFVGIVLVREAEAGSGATLFAGAPRPASCPSCPWPPAFLIGRSGPGRTAVLPAGDYRLILLAGADEVRVTLRLDGLDGSTEIRPAEGADVEVDAMDPAVPTPGTQPLAWSAASRDLGAEGGLAFFSTWVDGPLASAGTERNCVYKEPDPDEGPVQLCRRAVGWGDHGWVGGAVASGWYVPDVTGYWGFSYSRASVNVERFGAAAVWVRY